MKSTLLQPTAKPYLKIGKLIIKCYTEDIIDDEELDAFLEELNLLERGDNKSHNTISRSYWDKLSSKP